MLIRPGTSPYNFFLSKKYKDDLLTKEVLWNIPGLSEFTFMRTYSRKKENGKLETWNECVVRVIEGMFTILKTHAKLNCMPWNEKKAQKHAQEAADRMFIFKWLPPGRGLWIMGTEFMWEKGGAALNNCFTGETEFFHENSLCNLKALVGQDVAVIDHNGNTQTAAIKEFGSQEVVDIEFRPFSRRTNYTKKFSATRNHRWILADGSETTALKVGDKVKIDPINSEKNTQAYIDGNAHGFIFGDGSKSAGKPEKYHLRLCGKKNQYSSSLEASSYFRKKTQPDFSNGDFLLYFDSDLSLKDLPESTDSNYIAGFIDGWVNADGHKKKNGPSYLLDTQDSNAAIWLMNHAFFAGFTVTGISNENQDTNFGNRSHPLNRVSLHQGSTVYRVSSISNPRFENVYCAVQPSTHSFRLAGGFPTGNCGFVSTEIIGQSEEDTVLPFKFLMDMSMLGVGIGFDTKGAGKVEIKGYDYSLEPLEVKVEDTREGWVDLIGKVIEHVIYFKAPILPNLELVRAEGLPIRGFGGVSSGPEPLLQTANGIVELLMASKNKPLSSTLIVDIQNLIGKCVVAGNVRRSAEIAFGEVDDVEYSTMKDWNKNAVEMGNEPPDELRLASEPDYLEYKKGGFFAKKIVDKYRFHSWAYKFGGWRWSSNNSLFAKVGMDYKKYENSIGQSGEPGFAWLDLMKRFGRMKDPENNKDYRVKGGNPCLEQSLESYELCCLVETFPFYHDDYWDYQRTLKFAYLYAKTVTLVGTHFDITNSIIIRNRRIGCSMSGVLDAIYKFGRTPFFTEFADRGYTYINYVDKKYSEWLGIPESIKKTSIKPSGTTSLVAGVKGPGGHWPKMRSGYRLVRVAANSEQIPLLVNANFKVEPSVTDPLRTYVVYFPWITPEGMVSEEDVGIWEKFKMAADLQYWWADNQVSCTVEFTQDELARHELSRCLEAFDGQLKGISMLPRDESSYAQMPYTSAPYDEVLEYSKKLLPIDYSSLTNEGENGNANLFCDSGNCVVEFAA